MNSITLSIRRHINYIARYPLTALLTLTSCGVILFTSYQNKTVTHALGYILCAWLCCLLTDIVIYAFPKPVAKLPIKKSARTELFTIIICTVLGVAFLCIRFFTDWQHLAAPVKLVCIPLILFTFPIVLAIIYLFRYKYKPRELGININYWFVPILLHLVWGGVTMWVAPEKSHWTEMWKEYGILGALFTGLISAALPEEFLRMLLQSRIGRAFNAPAFGLFAATAIWGAMHIPVGYNQDHMPVTLFGAIESVAYLMPIGMFWGYLTYRTRSLIPSVLMHGFNLWGLQNF